jgi:hypothetical protein
MLERAKVMFIHRLIIYGIFFIEKKETQSFLFKFSLIAALMNSEKKNSVRFGLFLIDEWTWKYNLSLGLDLRSHVRQIPCVYKESFNA